MPVPLKRIENYEALHRFTQLVVNLVDAGRDQGCLQPEHLRRVLPTRMRQKGWFHPGGRLKLAAASQSFQEMLAGFAGLPELRQVLLSTEFARRWLERVFRPRRSRTHPLRVLLVIHWLFRDADEFLQFSDSVHLKKGVRDVLITPPAPHLDLGSKGNIKSQVVAQLVAGCSARSVASDFGIDVGTAMAWGAEAGVRPKRRPKAIHEALRSSMIRALGSGQRKSEVAVAHSVSIQAVTRLLRTEPGLRIDWQEALKAKLRRRHRQDWERSIRRMPGLGVKLHRQLHPATYAWLYRHDREWLSNNSPTPAASAPRRSTVRWDERDLTLSTQVRQIALQMQMKPDAKPIKLWEILQQLPELKAKQGALHRLPLTARALEDVTRKRSLTP